MDTTEIMQARIIGSLAEVAAADWNRLAGPDNPFIQYEFLAALERHNCLQEYGWYPQHVLIEADGKVVGAMPMYIKDNSYGEMVFDWGWADAYHRAGLRYYPKLVTAIPYTPATGPRLLIADDQNFTVVANTLIQAAISQAKHHELSGVHWLFPQARDREFFASTDLILRMGLQFQWENHAYGSFEHYLDHLSADKRKKIKRERRRVIEQDIDMEIRHGDDMTDELWEIYHRFYCSTFERKSGMPTLSLGFFKEIGRTMPRRVIVVFARHQGNYVASAFNLRGTTTLYGRHWGCAQDYHSLHFEACYYQGLDYCIDNQLQRFEPGAQGEHKLSRGFLPTPVWSAHWIAHPQFREIIAQHVQRERVAMEHEITAYLEHSPFKQA